MFYYTVLSVVPLSACLPVQEVEGPAAGYGSDRLATVILLTDGQPSSSPPEGEVAELHKYIQRREQAVEKGEARRACKVVTMVSGGRQAGVGPRQVWGPGRYVRWGGHRQVCQVRGAQAGVSGEGGTGRCVR